jgi:hypothetical protein
MKNLITTCTVLLLFLSCSNPKDPVVARLQYWHSNFLKLEKQLGLLSWYEIANQHYLNRVQVFENYPMYGNLDSLNWLRETKVQPLALPKFYIDMLETYQFQGVIKRATIDGLEKVAQLKNSDFVLPGKGNIYYWQILHHIQNTSPHEALRLFDSAYPTSLGILTLKNIIFQNFQNFENRISIGTSDKLLEHAYRIDKSMSLPADSFLQSTQEKYDQLYHQLFWDGGNRLYATDLPKLIRTINKSEYSDILNPEKIKLGLETFWRNLGIRIQRQSALHIMDSLATEKPPVVINLAIPDDVRIVFTTQSGLDALLQNFTALAIAEQNVFKLTKDPLSAYIQSPTTEIIRGGLTMALSDPQFLINTFEIDSLTAVEMALRIEFYLLWNARNIAIAKELIDLPDAEIQVSSFSNRLQTYQHMVLNTSQATWLLAKLPTVPQIYFSAISVIFGEQFLMLLQKRYGTQWYRSVEAGKWLKLLWQNAHKLEVDNFLKDLQSQ